MLNNGLEMIKIVKWEKIIQKVAWCEMISILEYGS